MLTRGDTGRVRTSACTCGSVKNLRAAAGTAALGFPHPHCPAPGVRVDVRLGLRALGTPWGGTVERSPTAGP